MKLKGKKAVVTGGSRGIGKAIVLELAEQGADVVFTDIAFGEKSPEDLASEFKSEISTDSNIFGFEANAAIFEDAQKTVDFAIEKIGGVDILVNNVGITKDTLMLRMSEDQFDTVINVNLKSVFNYTKAVLKPMMGNRYGKIVNMASVVGIIGNPGQSNYVASKAGIIGMTKSNAKEFCSRNITVNAVAPGFILTEMTDKLNEKQKEAILGGVPLNRPGQVNDVAKAVAFLSSGDSDYITGQVISVDGGMSM